MTLRPDQIGDKGQRFMVEALGYPHSNEWGAVAYSDTRTHAWAIADAIALAPGVMMTRVSDRRPKDPLTE